MARKGHGRNAFTSRPLRTDRAHGTGMNRNHYDRPDSKSRGAAQGNTVQNSPTTASQRFDWDRAHLLFALDMRELGYELSPEQYRLCYEHDHA